MSSDSVAEAKNHLPTLIDKAIEGEEVVITRHGKPVAELTVSDFAAAEVASALSRLVRMGRLTGSEALW